MKLVFTGHRPQKLNREWDCIGPVSSWIAGNIISIMQIHSPDTFVSGMALGLDTIAALLATQNNLDLIACIPYEGQESVWKAESKKMYHDILSYPKCHKIIVCEGGHANWKLQKRNEFMIDLMKIDEGDKLVAVWDGSEGGTANCVKYAKRKIGDENIIYLNPTEILKTVQ